MLGRAVILGKGTGSLGLGGCCPMWRPGALFLSGVREAPFQQSPKEGERSQEEVWGKNIPVEGTAGARSPGVGGRNVYSGRSRERVWEGKLQAGRPEPGYTGLAEHEGTGHCPAHAPEFSAR